jgi:glycosyltransferase involved in cell wall biosynthesis
MTLSNNTLLTAALAPAAVSLADEAPAPAAAGQVRAAASMPRSRPEPPGPIAISFVVPLFNEVDSLRPLYGLLSDCMRAIERPCEVIFVDDGSRDGSFAVLQALHAEDDRVRVIRLRRNFGQAAAMSAGFELARGEVIVTLDADLQNDPADVPRLLAKLAEGYDVVSGWRVRRQDPYLTRRLPSRIANALISAVTGVRLRDYGCSLKAYRREVLQDLQLYGQMHRFLPSLVSWQGVRIAEIPVAHARRRFGRSKYGLGRAVMVLLDLITVKFLLDYATRPIQIFGLVGFLCAGLGIALGLYLSVLKLVFLQSIGDRPLLLLAVLLTLLGVQFVTMGLLGELVIRNNHKASGKPTYSVRERLVR